MTSRRDSGRFQKTSGSTANWNFEFEYSKMDQIPRQLSACRQRLRGVDLRFPNMRKGGRHAVRLLRKEKQIAFSINGGSPKVAFVEKDPSEPTAIRITFTALDSTRLTKK
ncbi:hypothetical protein OAG56_00415 [Mariniblastus sp.]|jgi:hypothetical protein|nr:hypothetical protein [Mariniblastus sp.]MDB4755804.1 hypothetical protein [Mariniblastus sp.]